MFADGDDRVDPDFCRIPYEPAQKHNADLMMFQLDRKNTLKKRPKIIEPDGIKNEEKSVWLIYRETGALPCNKLYRRNLFRNNRSPEGRVYEAQAVIHKIVHEEQHFIIPRKFCIIIGNGREVRQHPGR